MVKSDFVHLIEELLELDSGTLNGTESLDEINMTSLAVIGFIALVDEQFGVTIPPGKIAGCATVADLAALLGDKISVGEAV